ncbi:MAG: L-threonylcarbamoyladenylate synthase [Schlesneria sp.]
MPESPDAFVTVERAATCLQAGGLVALPTETVYGLGANALDPVAVARIFVAKERPFFDPLIVHVPDIDWMPRVVSEFPAVALKLAERFWPGPLTLVLPKVKSIPDLVTSGLSNVGVRIPDHELTRRVLRLANVPVAAPSANPFGRLSPTTAEHVQAQLGDRIDAILDGGPCRVGIESTILQIVDNGVTLLRPGGISLEEIEALIGSVHHPVSPSSESPIAPGMLESHYAPLTPLTIVDHVPSSVESGRMGLLVLRNDMRSLRFGQLEELSQTGDLVIAAANFFQALHRLDAAGLDEIIAVRFPDIGLGRALNDRLKRAEHRRSDRSSC